MQLGFDSLFFARIDYQDRAKRKNEKSLEVIWRGSKSFGSSAQVSLVCLFVCFFFFFFFPSTFKLCSGAEWKGTLTHCVFNILQIFAGAFPENYEPPSDFYFEVNDDSHDSPIVQVSPQSGVADRLYIIVCVLTVFILRF